MVKGMIKTVPHADYDAVYRTLPLSQKPGYGKGLLDGVEIRQEDLHYKGSFDAERFIHGKVHGYLVKFAANMEALRLAEHQRKVAALRASSSSKGGIAASHGHDEIIDNHIKVALRLSSDRAMKASDLMQLPKSIRAFVVAQLIKDSGIDIAKKRSEQANRTQDRQVLKARMALRRFLLSLGATVVVKNSCNSRNLVDNGSVSRKDKLSGLSLLEDRVWNGRSQDLKDSVSARDSMIGIASQSSVRPHGTNSFSFSEKIGSARHFASQKDLISVLGLLIVAGSLRFSSKILNDVRSTKDKRSDAQARKNLSLSSSINSRRSGGFQAVAKKSVEGFGTAPIWYQQSMENGPPC